MFKRSLQDVLKDKVSEICVLPNWMAFAWPGSGPVSPYDFRNQLASSGPLSVHSAHGLRGSDTVLETKVFSCLRNTRSVACRGRLSQMSTGASDRSVLRAGVRGAEAHLRDQVENAVAGVQRDVRSGGERRAPSARSA
ncbi:unnamed protein product, partial [Prorocentrum cordatum]